MSFHIRPFIPDDYTAMIAIDRAIYPDYAATEDELRYRDEHRDPIHKFQRWVVEQDGRVVATGHYTQSFENYHPRKFWISIDVHPDAQRQGIGSTLYTHIVEALQQFDPLDIRSRVREDMQPGMHFLRARGFQGVWREWESRLDVTTFDPSPYNGLEEKLNGQGIEIKSFKELESDPECYRKRYEMESEVVQDIPSLDGVTPVSFDQFMELFINNPQALPEAHFIAIHNGEYIGISGLWKSDADHNFVNNLTGVRRAYRHRGIALALKLRGIAYAREHGGTSIKTWNDSPNNAMIAINMQLGFVRKVGWITFLKEFEQQKAEKIMPTTHKSTSGFAGVNGTRLYYEIAGEGYPLVLMHGGIMDSTMWDDQFETFAQHYRVMRYDLRGFGQSDLPGTESFSMRGDLRALLAYLGIEKANVLGISMAGSIAIDFMLDYPDIVNALILVAPGVNGFDYDAIQTEEEKAVFQKIDEAYESGDIERAVELETRAWVDGPNRTPEQVDPVVRKRVYDMNLHNSHRTQNIEWPATQKLEPAAIERLSEIRVPTLLIIGDGDVREQIAVVDALATNIPGAQKAVMHGVAHVPNMEHPAEFNQLVLDFLKTV